MSRIVRRRVSAVVVGVAGAAAVGAALWYVALPNWRPPLAEGEVYGIDVSHHQGHIDWDAVSEDGIEFAYIKASEGGDFADSRFDENWSRARAAGIQAGAYHFFTLCRQGDDQARWFLSRAEPDDDALPPAVDLELLGNCSARPDVATVNDELETFLNIIEDAWGRRAILYVGDDYASTYPIPDRLDRPRWQLRFLRRPTIDNWVVWQLHGYGHIEGIEGNVDLDIARIDALEALG